MNFTKALSCLAFACLISPDISAQTQQFPPIVVTGPRAVNNNLTPQQFDAFAQLMSKPLPPPTFASISSDGSDSDCPAARQAFKQSGCSIGGSESNPLNYNPNYYDAGTGLNQALNWAKNSQSTYGPASDKFITTLLAYEDLINKNGGAPADYGGFLLDGLATACEIQADRHPDGVVGQGFLDCSSAAEAMATEVKSSIDPVVKQGIIDKMLGTVGVKTDGSGSIGGGWFASWAANYQSTTNSLRVHHQFLLRESFCASLRTDVMLACGDSA